MQKHSLIISLPDNRYFGHKIEIKSEDKVCFELHAEFLQKATAAVQNIDKSNIDPKFLEPSCGSGYCDRPIVNLETILPNVIFLDNNELESVSEIKVAPKVSRCNTGSTLVEFCEFRGKTDCCMGCQNPYMQTIINVAKTMASNSK